MAITITPEMIQNARAYVEAKEKRAFCETAAEACYDKLTYLYKNGDVETPMPAVWGISEPLRSRYLMTALAGVYLGAEYEAEAGNPALMTEAEYDRWAESHVWNQLDRMKRDRTVSEETRNRLFDLLADFNELRRWLDGELRGNLTLRNDPLCRFKEMLDIQTSPEYVAQLLARLGQLEEALTGLREPAAEG